MKKYDYTKEVFAEAVRYLATGKDGIWDRLDEAFEFSLIKLIDEDIPEGLKNDWESVKKERYIEKMKPQKGSSAGVKLAEIIYSLHLKLERDY